MEEGKHRKVKWRRESTDSRVEEGVEEGKHRWSGGGRRAQVVRWRRESTDSQVGKERIKIREKNGVTLRNIHYLVIPWHTIKTKKYISLTNAKQELMAVI